MSIRRRLSWCPWIGIVLALSACGGGGDASSTGEDGSSSDAALVTTANLIADPGFESGLSGFYAQSSPPDSVERLTSDPISGSGSLQTTLTAAWDNVWWVREASTLPSQKASSFTISALVRGDKVSSASQLYVCAAAVYSGSTTLEEQCSIASQVAGKVVSLNATLTLDPTRVLSKVDFRITLDGSTAVTYTLDNVSAVLTYGGTSPSPTPTTTPTPTPSVTPKPSPTPTPSVTPTSSPTPTPTPSVTPTSSPTPTPSVTPTSSPTPTPTPSVTPTSSPAPTPTSGSQKVQASTEGIEKPIPENSYNLTLSDSLSVSLARNEVTGRVLKVSVPSCQSLAVTAPSGVTVSLFHMPWMKTTSASFKGGIVGNHYDPLVPISTTSEEVCPTDSYIWADIGVSSSVAPGSYSFEIGDLPVSLTVWNMTIPSTASVPIYIQLESFALLAAHGLSSSSSPAVEASLAQLYINELRADRIEPIEQRIADPSVSGSTMNLTANASSGASWQDIVLDGALAPVCAIVPTNISSSWDTASQLEAWQATLPAYAGLANAWAWITDEPTDLTGTATRAQLVRTNAPGLKTVVTHEPTTALVGLIDHFTVIFEYFMQSGHWTNYAETPGYWLYGSCMSHGNCSNGSPGTLTGTPDLMLDEPDVNPRAFPLVAYGLGGGAALYYDSTYSIKTAWTNQYFFGGNGDGNLFYPGVSGQMGFTSNQPVASIRLKALRQGQYDVEYLKLAAAAGVSTNFKTLVPDQFKWSRTNSDYEAMRNQIGTALSK
jgi:hypothetical protein